VVLVIDVKKVPGIVGPCAAPTAAPLIARAPALKAATAYVGARFHIFLGWNTDQWCTCASLRLLTKNPV
jgi:hypothetical protein